MPPVANPCPSPGAAPTILPATCFGQESELEQLLHWESKMKRVQVTSPYSSTCEHRPTETNMRVCTGRSMRITLSTSGGIKTEWFGPVGWNEPALQPCCSLQRTGRRSCIVTTMLSAYIFDSCLVFCTFSVRHGSFFFLSFVFFSAGREPRQGGVGTTQTRATAQRAEPTAKGDSGGEAPP